MNPIVGPYVHKQGLYALSLFPNANDCVFIYIYLSLPTIPLSMVVAVRNWKKYSVVQESQHIPSLKNPLGLVLPGGSSDVYPWITHECIEAEEEI